MSDEETRKPPAGDSSPEAEGDREVAAEGEGTSSHTGEEGDAAAEKAAAEAEAEARAEAAAKAKAAKEAAEAAKPPWERDPQAPQWEELDDDPIVVALRAEHGAGLVAARTIGEERVLFVRPDSVREVARALHDDHGFTMLIDICGADYGEREGEPRFEVIYHLLDLDGPTRIRLRVAVDGGEEVQSVVPVWRGANWPERETFDMYGIRFGDHPDMTRILMWEGFNGHPLRKDFPLEGVDTGSAIYPEYYEESAGPVTGTGTGWKPPKEEETAEEGAGERE